MVTLTINNHKVTVPENTTILQAANGVGIRIPHLCYLKDVNEIAACRVCSVELKGKTRLITACNTVCAEGMEIFTNSPKVRKARRTIVRLILSQHDCRCAMCVRSGNCSLQTIANEMGFLGDRYKTEIESFDANPEFPLIRDRSRCIKCMRCVQVCDKIQSLNIWDVQNTGKRTSVGTKDGQCLENVDCSLCGQCITHCPVGALRERDDVAKVLNALNDPEKVVLVQVAPAVRTAWGEAFNMGELATEKRMAATLRHIGFDYVFDTNFAADLTIMEETNEFIEKFKSGMLDDFPMFTSCCPGWMRFAKTQFPEIVDHISGSKSPQQMFGAVAKSYFAKVKGIDPDKIVCVSIMPCLAKKAEADISVMKSAGCGNDVDYVLTTRELNRMIKGEAIVPDLMPEEDFDSPLGEYTGAGVIFGATGGVMEAALRTAHKVLTGKNPDPDSFSVVRGMEKWKEASIEINGITVNAAVVHGLGNTRELIKALKRGEVSYHFVEVMACPGGCVGGGGQPIHDGIEMAETRAPILYDLDRNKSIRFSHENPEIIKLYDDYLGEPGSEIAHRLLHVDQNAWKVNEK